MGDYEWSRPLKRLLQKKTEHVHSLIICDRNLWDIARQIGISFGAVQSILTDIRDVQGLS